MNKFNQSTPQVQPPAPPSYSDRSFLHEIKAGVLVPLWQSAVTGAMLGTILSIILSLFDLRAMVIIKWGAIFGAITTTFMWIMLQRRWLNLTKLEQLLGVELDGIPNEPPKKVIITVNKVKENGHVEVMNHTFPVSDQQIARFFTTVKTSTRGGKGISRREWTPKRVNGFSEGEWDAFYKELVHQQLVTVRGSECILTNAGEEIADGWYMREQEQASPPSGEDV